MITTTTYARLSDPAYTGPLNQQKVAVLKAKVFSTPYARILADGDSITYGANAGNAADPSGCIGWRKTVNDAIIASRGASVPVEWVGFQDTGYSVDTVVRYHAGVGGRTTTLATAAANADMGPGIRGAEIWIVGFGTNDARSSKANATFQADYTAMYNARRARLVATGVTPIPIITYTPEDPNEPSFNAFITTYNAGWAAFVAGLAGSPLITSGPPGLVAGDMNAGDNPHPLATGYENKIAPPITTQVLNALTTLGL